MEPRWDGSCVERYVTSPRPLHADRWGQDTQRTSHPSLADYGGRGVGPCGARLVVTCALSPKLEVLFFVIFMIGLFKSAFSPLVC